MGGIDGTAASETLGVAGGRTYGTEAKTNHDVRGQHGHRDGLRRGKTTAHFETYVSSRCSPAALFRAMTGLDGQTTVEHVDIKFQFTRGTLKKNEKNDGSSF